MRGFIALFVCAAAAAPSLNYDPFHSQAAPLISASVVDEVPNSYIVKFKSHVTEASASKHHSWVQKIHSNSEDDRLELRKRSQLPLFGGDAETFGGLKHTLKIGTEFFGYAGHFDDSVIEEVRRHPDVEFVEKDSIVHALEEPDLEKNAPWGLARISHRKQLSFGTYNKYLYAAEGGEGVDVYVIDTGCNVNHVDFEGRASWGKTIPTGDEDVDGNGHGTHCSGTIAGKKYGVAKKASVHAVKVLRSNGSGSMSDVMKGVEWAAEQHLSQVAKAKKGERKGFKGSTANMSLGGGKSPSLDQAVNAAVSVGLHFAVAAGNDNADACKYSPAAAEKAITVGASALDDSRAYFSNWGKCVDIFGPGLSIQSTWIGSNTAVNTISGTSMASPHICGLTAYFLSLQPSKDSEYGLAEITPEKLKSNIITIATKDALSDIPKDTPNLLAWNGGGYSNYSQIVEQGGYVVDTLADKSMGL
ncbi:serine protease 2 [Durotheca rogersii]|uniref:serine protease 2 n=1 Tax=Durotheca rogersii TaxID=419775 RepID=UPI00221E5A3E|nr:serine protease 2 [Durotheca rogersii]KAI5861059.1 serine protease 2 [Durotheca rogersii]